MPTYVVFFKTSHTVVIANDAQAVSAMFPEWEHISRLYPECGLDLEKTIRDYNEQCR